MKPNLNLQLGKLGFNIGWYRGEEFAIFRLTILEIDEHFVLLLGIHIAKFLIAVFIW